MTTVIKPVSIIPTSPADKAAILDAIKEADISLSNIDMQKDQIGLIIEEVNEKYGINKGTIRKLINTYHKQNFSAVEQEVEDFISLYAAVVK